MIRGWDYILPGCGGTMTLPQGETLAARPAPPHWPSAGEEGPSTNGVHENWGLAPAGVKVICLLYNIPGTYYCVILASNIS